jgi:transposase
VRQDECRGCGRDPRGRDTSLHTVHIAIKSEACSSILVVHRTRDFLVRQRTQIGNAIRADMTGQYSALQ